MAELRFGWVEGRGHGREITMADGQYLARRGGKFVYLNAGLGTLAASAIDKVYGWAETPKDASGKNAWLSSTGDKVFAIDGIDDVYEIPYTTSTVCATWIGKGAGLSQVGATYAMVQKASFSSTATPLSVVGADTDNGTLYVKIKTTKKQAL